MAIIIELRPLQQSKPEPPTAITKYTEFEEHMRRMAESERRTVQLIEEATTIMQRTMNRLKTASR